MISFDMTGKKALVTGGASGIGLAVTELFQKAGATVAVNYLPSDVRAEQAVQDLVARGLKILAAPGDVSQQASADAMVAGAIGQLGGLDFLINNAGTPGTPDPIDFADLDAMSEPLWDRILATNLVGPFRCTRAAANALRASKGAVVNTASVSGFGIRGSSIAYAASKAGLINLTRSLARALAPDVRVNAVAPGLVQSPWTQGWPEERKQRTKDTTLLKRLTTPEEIAEVIGYLAAGASYITGQTIIADGGQA